MPRTRALVIALIVSAFIAACGGGGSNNNNNGGNTGGNNGGGTTPTNPCTTAMLADTAEVAAIGEVALSGNAPDPGDFLEDLAPAGPPPLRRR